MFMAENLTISIPGTYCNKKCPYCISKMTPDVQQNTELWNRNLEKVYHVAKIAHVTSVLLTGKGEPTLYTDDLIRICKLFRKFPVELQTNGIIFKRYLHDANKVLLNTLYLNGLDTISLSIDFINSTLENELYDFSEFFEFNKRCYNMNIRLALNYTNHAPAECADPYYIVNLCKKFGIRQVIIRNIMPTSNVDTNNEQYKWIVANTSNTGTYDNFMYNFERINKFLIRETTFGMQIFDVDGISFACSHYCVQENSNDSTIRSLIYQADGHLYTSWASPASILF